jgi:hypothetical protein
MKKDIAPKWVLWISFISFCILGIVMIFSILFSLKSLSTTQLEIVLGEIVGSVVVFYLIIYIPSKIIYENYLK